MAQKKIQPDQLDVSIVTQSELDAAIAAIPAGDVTLTGAQTLTNKTLMSPKINEFLDTNGNKVLTMNPVTSAVNYIRVDNNATGSAPAFIAVGTDTDIGINFIPKNTGRVQISGVNIPSISSTDTLTNKSFQDSTTFIVDETDATKKAQFQASSITTGTTRTYTLPNSNGTLLSSGVTVTVAQGGTGRSTATTAYGVLAAGTTATGIQQTIAPGTTGQFLKSNGAAALGSFASIAEADVTNLVTDLAAKAPLASPTFTGTPAAPTPTAGDNTTKLATTEFVNAAANSSVTLNGTLTGTVNGTNAVFTLPTVVASVVIYKNGVRQKPGAGNDYVFSGGNTITFEAGNIPATGAVLLYDAVVSNQLMISGSNSTLSDEVPTGAVNGTNKLYTTARAYVSGSLEVWINGIKQQRGVHFVETSNTAGTFTMDEAPITGDNVLVAYQFVVSVSGNADTVDGYHYFDLMPLGAGIDFWLPTLPSSNWMFANGQAISRTTYAALFAQMGTTFGAGDGTTTFNLPDKRGRTTAGKDDMGGTSADRLTNQSGGLNGDVLGAAGGAERHTLALSEAPNVTGTIGLHGGENGSFFVNVGGAFSAPQGYTGQYKAPPASTPGSQSVLNSIVFNNGGGGGSHNNVQPTIVANYIIKVA